MQVYLNLEKRLHEDNYVTLSSLSIILLFFLVNFEVTEIETIKKIHVGLFDVKYTLFVSSELKIQNIFNRTDETEWDKMLNFMKRKVERFVKTMTFELTIPTSESDRDAAYEPRFLSDIFNEVNILEDKKDTLFCKYLSKMTTYGQRFVFIYAKVTIRKLLKLSSYCFIMNGQNMKRIKHYFVEKKLSFFITA